MRQAIQQGFTFDAPLFAVQGPKAAEVPPAPVQVPEPEVFRVEFMGGVDLGTVGGLKAAPEPDEVQPVRRGPALVVVVNGRRYSWPVRSVEGLTCPDCEAYLSAAVESEGGRFAHCVCGAYFPLVPAKG